MSRSYRSLILAIGLILAGASPPNSQTIEKQAGAQKANPPTPSSAYSPYPNYNPDPCYKAENHDTADLCAQWRAAIAAEKAAEISRWGNWISALSGVLSFVSVVLVIYALRQTERSLREAKAANEIASEMGRRQLRAYLSAEDQTIYNFFRGGGTTLQVKIWNRGQTPARHVEAWCMISATTDNPDHVKIRMTPGIARSKADVGPGQWVLLENASLAPLKNDAYESVASGGVAIVFAGYIRYQDIFGKTHRTTFKYHYRGNGNWAETAADLTACGRGNCAN